MKTIVDMLIAHMHMSRMPPSSNTGVLYTSTIRKKKSFISSGLTILDRANWKNKVHVVDPYQALEYMII